MTTEAQRKIWREKGRIQREKKRMKMGTGTSLVTVPLKDLPDLRPVKRKYVKKANGVDHKRYDKETIKAVIDRVIDLL